MLPAETLELLVRILNHLNLPDAHAGSKALASELGAVLAGDTALRASVAAKRRARGENYKGGRPSKLFAIVTEPGGTTWLRGLNAVAAALATQLGSHGRNHTPKASSLAVALNRAGSWTTLLDTDNGTIAVTVRHATEQELAQHLQ